MQTATWTIASWRVTSYGNGLAYSVEDSAGNGFFLQGEDAAEWRDEYAQADEWNRVSEFMRESMINYGGADEWIDA